MTVAACLSADVVCPHCGIIEDDFASVAKYCSVWGEDGPQQVTCEGCSKIYFITEKLTRTFACTKERVDKW